MSNSFYFRVYFILILLFFAGGIGLFWFFRKKERQKNLKTKYWIYLLIVILHILLLQFSIIGFRILTVFVLLLGFYELIKLVPLLIKEKNWTTLLFAVLIYLSVCWCYFQFTFLSPEIIWFVYLLVVVFDGFGQLFGVVLGKTKLVKKISPGKTWEGLVGGIASTILIVLLFKNDFIPVLNEMYFEWILVIAFAFLGDLLASWLKRKAGIKDYSRIIPGHGGVLDRFDSLLLAGSAMYLKYFFL